MRSCCQRHLPPLLLLLCLACSSSPAGEFTDHHVQIKIDRRATIVTPESPLKLKRAMLGMQRHPDGSILLCLQTLPVLLRSSDDGRTWTTIDVQLPGNPQRPILHGLGISRDGRVWLMHQNNGRGTDLFVSVSRERQGAKLTWTTTAIDYARLAPRPDRPYTFCFNDYNTFFQQPDGHMALGVGLRYEDDGDYQQTDQSRPGFHETLIRSTDGGRTWGDPTPVHQHVAETAYAVDPRDPLHILAMTRKQRQLLRGEDPASVTRQAGVPLQTAWPWKGAILLESTDGGRSFQEVADSYLGYYSHRGTLLWARNNVIVAPHTAPGQKDYRLVVNLSLDGGRTWVDGTKQGTRAMRQARHFELVASPPGFSFTTPTVELSANHFLTVHCQGHPLRTVEAIFWHIEPAAKPPLRVSSARQLFIDDALVESVEGVTRTLHQPAKHPQNPLLARADEQADRWDAGMPICFSSVLYDPQNRLFKMWYSLHQQGEGDADSVLCFASSRDGIRWHKPALGMYEFRGTKNNNIVMPHSALSCGVFLDPRETDPARRFKMMHMWQDYQVYTSYSADGFRWTPYNDRKPVFFRAPGHDSHMIAYWDAALARYVGIIRDRTGRISDVRPRLVVQPEARRIWRQLWDPQKNRAPENHSIRRVGQIESTDFVHWDNYRMIIGPDSEDPLNQDQFYNLEVMPYEGLRIGLMTVFSYDPQYSRGAVQLVSSRDGRHWQRVADRQVFLPLATRSGDFDWGSIYPLQAPIEHDDQIWIYYNGYGVDHNHTRPPGVEGMPNGIGLAKLRLDGFVSLDAGPDGGSVTTRPFAFTGHKLVINADATAGQVLVEVLDRRGEPIAGFGKSDCDRVTGDALRHPVSWQGNSELAPLEGETIKLRFHLLRAGLYSFSFPT